MTWAELRPAFAKRRYPCAERASAHGLIARNNQHDIGNAINRKNHGEYGAILAYSLLEKLDIPLTDRVIIVSAIGNHDESTGGSG